MVAYRCTRGVAACDRCRILKQGCPSHASIRSLPQHVSSTRLTGVTDPSLFPILLLTSQVYTTRSFLSSPTRWSMRLYCDHTDSRLLTLALFQLAMFGFLARLVDGPSAHYKTREIYGHLIGSDSRTVTPKEAMQILREIQRPDPQPGWIVSADSWEVIHLDKSAARPAPTEKPGPATAPVEKPCVLMMLAKYGIHPQEPYVPGSDMPDHHATYINTGPDEWLAARSKGNTGTARDMTTPVRRGRKRAESCYMDQMPPWIIKQRLAEYKRTGVHWKPDHKATSLMGQGLSLKRQWFVRKFAQREVSLDTIPEDEECSIFVSITLPKGDWDVPTRYKKAPTPVTWKKCPALVEKQADAGTNQQRGSERVSCELVLTTTAPTPQPTNPSTVLPRVEMGTLPSSPKSCESRAGSHEAC